MHAGGSSGSVCLLLWLRSVGLRPSVVVPAFASCKLRCSTAARGRSFDRSQKRRYNWGHNTFAGEAHLGIHDELLVSALSPQYAMRMIGRMIAPSVISSKAAISYHFKTGQWNHPQDQMMLPCRPTGRQGLRKLNASSREARQGDRARGISTGVL